jgi:Zn-dependent protease
MQVLRWLFPFFQGLLVGILAMLFHELGHLIAAPLVGIKIKRVGLTWKGLYTLREHGTAERNLLVSLAGPLMNLALLALWPLWPKLGLANFCFAFFNILPIEGSDGERVWKCWRQMKRDRAARGTSHLYTAYGPASSSLRSPANLIGEAPPAEPGTGD